MKKNSKYIVIGGTLLCVSLAILVVASTATSGSNCDTCQKSRTADSSHKPFMSANAGRAD